MKRYKSGIDFSNIEWDAVQERELDFFYREALVYNDKIIDDINAVNTKAYILAAAAQPVLCAAYGALLMLRRDGSTGAVFQALLCACVLLIAATVTACFALLPRMIIRGEGSPYAYFSTEYYKRSMPGILAGNIAALDRYIQHNHRVLRARSRLLIAADIAFIAAPMVTLAAVVLPPWAG
jgi:hypothetical protein